MYNKNQSQLEDEQNIIRGLNLTGDESKDRLIIQECIDKNKIKSNVLYNGNTVYPFEKIVKEYRKLEKSGSLEDLSKRMYDFFIYACGDIAHYDISGFKIYYNFSFKCLENELLSRNIYTNRFSDCDKIFKELKIGKYFGERENYEIKNNDSYKNAEEEMILV